MVILHLSAWTFSSEKITVEGLYRQINKLLQNKLEHFFQNPLVDLFQARCIFWMRLFTYFLFIEFYKKQFENSRCYYSNGYECVRKRYIFT
jgi:hypothetical protein